MCVCVCTLTCWYVFCAVNQSYSRQQIACSLKRVNWKEWSEEITYRDIGRAKDPKRMVRCPGTCNSETRLSLLGLRLQGREFWYQNLVRCWTTCLCSLFVLYGLAYRWSHTLFPCNNGMMLYKSNFVNCEIGNMSFLQLLPKMRISFKDIIETFWFFAKI